MAQPPSPAPLDPSQRLVDSLREQGSSPEESAELLPALLRLGEWQAPEPSGPDTERLIARLTAELPAHSEVREAIRKHSRDLGLLLATAGAQVSLLGISFWLISALLTLAGAVVVLSRLLPDEALVLRIGGPLLAYLGAAAAFRGRDARILELEFTCLPSPAEIVLARLVVVLGYDVGLALGLGLLLWAGGSTDVLELTLSWFMPLLLVAGLALLLSLRLPLRAGVSLAYIGWLAFLAVTAVGSVPSPISPPVLLGVAGGVGVALLAIALMRLRAEVHRLVPYA
ncbi:MAG: hypothetical protein J2P45_30835 [Candidatus Dormibacteraeota bacterium]|nr:hypothetical protein [Candidatus Dormibacteraeota bacterium]